MHGKELQSACPANPSLPVELKIMSETLSCTVLPNNIDSITSHRSKEKSADVASINEFHPLRRLVAYRRLNCQHRNIMMGSSTRTATKSPTRCSKARTRTVPNANPNANMEEP